MSTHFFSFLSSSEEVELLYCVSQYIGNVESLGGLQVKGDVVTTLVRHPP